MLDVNGDGLKDILRIHYNKVSKNIESMYVLLNNGSLSRNNKTELYTVIVSDPVAAQGWKGLGGAVSTDLNGDGKEELIIFGKGYSDDNYKADLHSLVFENIDPGTKTIVMREFDLGITIKNPMFYKNNSSPYLNEMLWDPTGAMPVLADVDGDGDQDFVVTELDQPLNESIPYQSQAAHFVVYLNSAQRLF
jgi:hypothetical protein